MQTFLPYPDFVESAQVLDQARLGKQRVEALQVLRAVTLPGYGWQSHPAIAMWRGHRTALTAYALAITDEWIAQGHADTVRPQVLEFAPVLGDVVADPRTGTEPGRPAAAAALVTADLPRWLGDDAVHRSHRSKLVQKEAEWYRGRFPGVPDDLDYVWPGADPGTAPPTDDAALSSTRRAWVVRPGDAQTGDDWRRAGVVTVAESSSRGRTTPAWTTQRDAFAALGEGEVVAVPDAGQQSFSLGRLVGDAVAAQDDDRAPVLLRRVEWDALEVRRHELPDPALAQDTRTVFPLALA
ncbi:MSMEG_6728 family protein [Frigoribacterium sp. ACAM 257]|uniref:MSMEG_6728 family protein n=1 Tax=Frigoribacterium sp. ACAM 257 TaxID=2508998 RepID=UPI001CB9500B|nr:MSMEG_6728 family protein [Frigoribacterium sp. ACAM 257]